MTGNLLTTVEQIIPGVDPDLGAFLSMRLALIEAALGEPGRAIERLEALPESFVAAGRTWDTSSKLADVIFRAPAEVAGVLIDRVDAPLRTSYLIRAAHARHEAGDQIGAEWLLRQAEARWGGLEPLLRSYAKEHGRPEAMPLGIGPSEVYQLATIRVAGALDEPHLIEEALTRMIADDSYLKERQDRWVAEMTQPSRLWLHALMTLIRLRLRTGNLAGIGLPLEWLSPSLEDGAIPWEILRYPGGASVLRGPRNNHARVQAVLLADVIDALLADEAVEEAHAVLDLLQDKYVFDPRLRRTITAVADAEARSGEFERAAAVIEGYGSEVLRVTVLLKGYRDTGDPRYIEQARQAAGERNADTYYRMLAETMAELGEIEKATLAADRVKVSSDRPSALKAVARAHLERGDAGSAAALLSLPRGMEHEWYRVEMRSAMAELQIERGEMEAAIETTLSIAELPADGSPTPNVIQSRCEEQVRLLRTIIRAYVYEPGQVVPPPVTALRDPFLRAVCLLEVACPLPDEWP